ncbi:MAG TPA: sigma-70 family RNA polymerase sigma factor [Nocardioidaceae bacterium]|nr:sigma-70 family RNA polymerase sigma factor [Nocardioidaceae bacterium]
MTELLSGTEATSDAELISRVRGGDVAAYGELFSRHVDAANRLSRQLVRGPDVDDLVSEAFAKVLQVLQGGGGPDVAFRAYLLTSVRRLHVDRMRAGAKTQPSDDMAQFDVGIPFQDPAVADFDNSAAARAFASLPERWQLVLWHLEVEGQKPADVAPLLGMSANSVSALAYRAREGLRQAFLTMHLSDISAERCRWVNEHLGGYVRSGLSRRDAAKVEEHLDECRRCTAMYMELTEVNSNLAGIIAPLLLGAAAAGYLSSSGAVGTTGLLALFGRARDAVAAHSSAATASAVAAGVAAATTAGVIAVRPEPRDVITGADQQIVAQAPAAPGAGTDVADRPQRREQRVPRERTRERDTTAQRAVAEPAPVPVATPTPPATEDVPAELPTEVPTDVPTDLPADLPTDLPADLPTDALPTPPVEEPGGTDVTPPGDGTTDPGDGTSDPGEGDGDPGEGTTDPGDGTTDPGNGTSDPGNGTTDPGDGDGDGDAGEGDGDDGDDSDDGDDGDDSDDSDEDPLPLPLQFMGYPAVTAVASGEQFVYTVAVTLGGVEPGDEITFMLIENQARFAAADGCDLPTGAGGAKEMVCTVDASGTQTFRFDVRLPSGAGATLQASRGDEFPVLMELPEQEDETGLRGFDK